MSAPTERPVAANFVRDLVDADNQQGTFGGRVQTRFPPEPNGYLHIGHAKAICVDFGVAAEFGGRVQPALRRHQSRHRRHRVRRRSIIDDLTWLGFEPGEPILYASDYFEQLYEWAELLDHATARRTSTTRTARRSRAQRGGYGKPGIESPYRDRPVEENLDLFRRMRAGEFADGSHVLRAKIDMQHENMQLRDPVMYRIRRRAPPAHRRRVGDLSDLRLGPRAERRDRGRHALAVHARVRQPPGAVRLVPRAAAAAVRPAAPDRVRPARTHPHDHVEAQAGEARRRRRRRRMGRPAHADAARAAPPRLSGVGDP